MYMHLDLVRRCRLPLGALMTPRPFQHFVRSYNKAKMCIMGTEGCEYANHSSIVQVNACILSGRTAVLSHAWTGIFRRR